MTHDRHTPDDNKRSEVISIKVTERMLLDLLRLAAADDRSMSDYLYGWLRRRLYGEAARLHSGGQSTTSDQVDRA